MRVAYVQTDPTIGQTDNNLDRAVDLIGKVHDADLVVLPELFHSGYKFESKAEAESLACEIPSGGVVQALIYAARKWEMNIAAGVLELSDGKLYNSSVLVSPDDVILTYRKLHLFYEEKDIFTPGDEKPGLVDVSGAKVGMLICFDWVFGGVWNYLARQGVGIVCHPSNLVLEKKCKRGIPVRAMENRIFIITANRVGAERGLRFVGGSQIVDPDGNILSKAPEEGEHWDMVRIDPDAALDKNMTSRNNILEDARWDMYPPPGF